MTFGDIPLGISLFIDANTLIYDLAPHPTLRPICRSLVERIARQDLTDSLPLWL